MTSNVVLFWSGGKDSMLAFHGLNKQKGYHLAGLMSTFAGPQKRINLHFVKSELITIQVRMLNLPLFPVYIPDDASNEAYERAHLARFRELKDAGIEYVAFGDIFLETIREYREKLVAKSGLKPVFPLWGRSSKELMTEFFINDYKAITAAVDNHKLGEQFLGREFTPAFLASLPAEVDLCGENGEFHSFVYDGPEFQEALKISTGKIHHINYKPDYDLEMLYTELELNNRDEV